MPQARASTQQERLQEGDGPSVAGLGAQLAIESTTEAQAPSLADGNGTPNETLSDSQDGEEDDADMQCNIEKAVQHMRNSSSEDPLCGFMTYHMIAVLQIHELEASIMQKEYRASLNSNDPSVGNELYQLALMLADRYVRTGNLGDLEKAIQAAQNGLTLPSIKALCENILRALKFKLERHPGPPLLAQTSYQYRPLNPDKHEIRLLWIEPYALAPSAHEKVVECRLYHASLLDKPEYMALSYVWGNPKETRVIKLNGFPFEVTVNLDIALRKMRERNVSRALWVDAVCINQGDLVERGEQIQHMRTIYSDAFAVSAWIGDAEDDTELAVQMIEELGSEAWGKDPETEEAVPVKSKDWLREDGSGEMSIDFHSRSWKAFQQLLGRPYFTRCWIIQELTVPDPQKILVGCGTFWIPWLFWTSTFSKLSQGADILAFSGGGFKHFMDISMIGFQYQLGKIVFSDLIECSMHFNATQPHDLLYAVLGLARGRTRAVLKPDYSKPLEQVSAELIKHIIESEGKLDSLHAYRTRVSQTPSWVPQIPTPVPQERSFRSVSAANCCASADWKPYVHVLADLKTITIRGLPVDTVTSVQGPFDSKTDIGVKLLCTRDFQIATLEAIAPHFHGADQDALEQIIEERLSKTLILGLPLSIGTAAPVSSLNLYHLINS